MAAISLAATVAIGAVVVSPPPLLKVRFLTASENVSCAAATPPLNRERGIIASVSDSSVVSSAGLSLGGGLEAVSRRVQVTPSAVLGVGGGLKGRGTAEVKTERSMLGVGFIMTVTPSAPVKVTSCARFSAGKSSLGACDVVAETMNLWGIENLRGAPDFAKRRALHDLNASLQVVWNQATDRNYWTRQTEVIEIDDGLGEVVLDDSIQNVIGPARSVDGRPLVPIATRGELDQYDELFLDDSNAETYPPSSPLFYYIERLNQSGSDPAKCIFHVRPPSNGSSSSVKLDVVKEAPRFTWDDVEQCATIPIPHQYVESLLLPVIRHAATSFHLFIAEAQRDSISNDYQMARALLDLADPLPGKAGDNNERRGES